MAMISYPTWLVATLGNVLLIIGLSQLFFLFAVGGLGPLSLPPWNALHKCAMHLMWRRSRATMGWGHFLRFYMREYFSVHPYPAWHVDHISLWSAWVEPSSAVVTKILWFLFESTPLDWDHVWAILNND